MKLMRRLTTLIVFAGIFIAHTAAQTPSITGTWQGTLNVGKELRLVFNISNATGGGLTAMMYSIDQGAQGLPASAVTFQGNGSNIVYIDWDNDLVVVVRWIQQRALDEFIGRVLSSLTTTSVTSMSSSAASSAAIRKLRTSPV